MTYPTPSSQDKIREFHKCNHSEHGSDEAENDYCVDCGTSYWMIEYVKSIESQLEEAARGRVLRVKPEDEWAVRAFLQEREEGRRNQNARKGAKR